MHLILLCKSVFVYGPWNVMCGPAQQWEGLHSLVLTVLSLNWTQIWGKKIENTQYIRKVLQLTTAFVDLVLMRIQTWFDPFCPLYSCVNHLTDRQLNKCHRLLAVFTGTMPTLGPWAHYGLDSPRGAEGNQSPTAVINLNIFFKHLPLSVCNVTKYGN